MNFLATNGRFLVLTDADVQVHLLTDTALRSYYDGVTIAETRSRDPLESVLYVLRQFFGPDATQALPADTRESLMFYIEHYESRLAELVKQLAAVILTGQQFSTDQGGGGARVRPRPQPQGSGPTGTTFQPVAQEAA